MSKQKRKKLTFWSKYKMPIIAIVAFSAIVYVIIYLVFKENGIFPVDDQTIAYIEKHSKKPYEVFEADEDAEYEQVVEINLSEVSTTVAFPHLP